MTGQQSDIQWYIARNGKQHGPLSDVEMRTFVAQGHLKPTDLIWRPGFADWRPAPAVFPFPAPDAAPPPAPRTGPPRSTTQQPRPAAHQGPAASAPMQGPGAGPSPGAPAPGSGVPSRNPDHTFEPDRIRVARGSSGAAPSRGKRVAGILVLLLLIGGGAGWYLWQNGGLSLPGTQTADEGAETPVVRNDTATTTPPAAPGSASPDAIQQQENSLDAKYQQTPMWTVVKREFPDWYGDRLREAATLSAENKPQEEITKHMAQALVQLRRQHAQEALSASTDKLKVVANAFLDNLKNLASRSVTACYGFISQGETSPVVLELLQSPDQGAAVQAQVAAIFEAIADGRKSPTTHERAGKQDYEILVQELSKLGWKEDDLKVFSNPSALAREPPARVCQMVQDWFVAHLSVQDAGTQERLLVETLKPVVSG